MASLRTVVSQNQQPIMKGLMQRKNLLSMTQSLTTPSAVAHLFDWKKSTSTLLTLRITKQSIDCGVVSHPILHNNSCSSAVTLLPSIPLVRPKHEKTTSSTLSGGPNFDVNQVTQSLQQITRDYDVCGIVVVYPSSSSSSSKNASTGRTLHVLDHLPNVFGTTSLKNGVNSSTKPICLFDPNHLNSVHDHDEDEWGRTQAYCTHGTASPIVHCAKQQQQLDKVSCSAVLEQTWNNFVQLYWPNVGVNDNDYTDDDLSNFVRNKLSSTKGKKELVTYHQSSRTFQHPIPRQNVTGTVHHGRHQATMVA